MRKNLFLLIVLFLGQNLLAQKDTIWFNKNWEKGVTKKEAAYYRLSPVAKGNGYIINDYYISGKKQMEGFSLSKDQDLFDGFATWYHEDGSISQKAEYKKGVMDGKLATFLSNGEKSEATYKDNVLYDGTIIYDYIYYYAKATATNGIVSYQKIYDPKNPKFGYEFFYENNELIKQVFYDEKGSKIGESSYGNGTYTPTSGTYVEYYYEPLKIKAIYQYKDSTPEKITNYYKNGKIKYDQSILNDNQITVYYDQTGKQMGKLTEVKNDYGSYSPQDGNQLTFNYSENNEDLILYDTEYANGKVRKATYYDTNGAIQKIATYNDNDTIILEENFDKKGNITSTLSYNPESSLPWNGTLVTESGTAIYKDGKKTEENIVYKNGKTFKSQKGTTAQFFDRKGKLLSTLTLYDKYNNKSFDSPFTGIDYYFSDDVIYSSNKYEKGSTIESISYNTKITDKLVPMNVSKYGPNDMIIAETSYFENGTKKTEIKYNSYTPSKGTYYNTKGKVIAEYDFIKNTGTEYKYFEGTDAIEYIKTAKDGVTSYEKKFIRDYNYSSYDNIYRLLSEIDYNKKGTFYDINDITYTAEYKNGQPFNGKTLVVDYYSKVVLSYKNGLVHGEQLYYDYYTNDLTKKENYLNNELNGNTEVYSSGTLTQLIPYKNNMINGKVLYYDTAGRISSSLEYVDDVIQNGTATEFDGPENSKQTDYKNGKISETRTYVSSKVIERQVLEGENTYDVTSFYQDGKTKFRYKKSSELLHGKIQYFDKKGKKQYEAELKNGELIDGEIWLGNSTNYYMDTKAEYLKIVKNKKEIKTQGIILPNKIEFEIIEKMMNDTSKSKLNYVTKTEGIYPSDLYNNLIPYYADYSSGVYDVAEPAAVPVEAPAPPVVAPK